MKPLAGLQRFELRPAGQLHDRLARHDGADEVLFVPTREDDQFARGVVHARTHHRGVPLPAVGADERRIGLQGILVEVVEDEAVDAVARQRALAPHREQTAPAADDLDLVGRADVVGRPGAALDGGGGEDVAVFARLEDALHTAVELRGQRPRVGSDRHPAVGVEPQHIGRQQRGGPHALAVLGRHGDDQPPHTPPGEGFQHTVIVAVEALQLQKRIDQPRKGFERRRNFRLRRSGIPGVRRPRGPLSSRRLRQTFHRFFGQPSDRRFRHPFSRRAGRISG